MSFDSLNLLAILRISSDAGLLALIWIVQLVIYPSFKYYELPNLKVWHDLYTKRITIVVMPLMLLQLSLSVYNFILGMNDALVVLDMFLVLLTWITTFLIFVPLHNSITKDKHAADSVNKLVRYNWIRTFLWSVIFIMTFYCAL